MPDEARGRILSPRDETKLEEDLKKFEQSVRRRTEIIYNKKSAKGEEIVSGLVSQYRNKYKKIEGQKEDVYDSEGVKDFAVNSLKALDGLVLRNEQTKNILRQEKEVKTSHTKPGEIDLATLMAEMEDRMGIAPVRWDALHDEYGADFFRYRNFTLNDVIDEIRTRKEAVLHTQPENGKKFSPKGSYFKSYSYRQLLDEARRLVKDEEKAITKNLHHLIEHGVEMPPVKERDDLDKAMSRAETRAALSGVGAVKDIFDYVGKGLWSKSDPNKNRHLRAFYKQRNGLFSNLLSGLNPRGSKNGLAVKNAMELLNKNNAELENEGLIDPATFAEISNLIKEELERESKDNPGLTQEHAEKMKELNERINALNQKVVEAAKGETSDSDAMHKWRMLQVVLLVTPFFGISALGPVMSVFNGVLMNSGGIVKGITSLMSFEYTGPFGWILEQMHIPQLIEAFFGLPVVSAPFDLLNATLGSDMAQTFFGQILNPLAASPTAALLLAGGFSLFRAGTEIKHSQKYGKAFKEYSDQLKKDMVEMAEEAEKLGENWDPTKMVNGQFEALRNFRLRCNKNELAIDLANQQSDPVDFLKKLMGADLAAALEKNHVEILDEDGKISNKALIEFLQKIPENNFYEKAIIYDDLLKQEVNHGRSADELIALASAKASDPQGKKIVDAWTKKQENEFVIEKAQDMFSQTKSVQMRKKFSEVFDEFESAENEAEKSGAIAKMENLVKAEQVRFFKEDFRGAGNDSMLKRLLLTTPTDKPEHPRGLELRNHGRELAANQGHAVAVF